MDLDFQDIYNKLLDVMPIGWDNAIFMAEYTSGSYSMRCFVKEKADEYTDVMKLKGVTKTQIIKTYKTLNDIFQKERNKLNESCWYAVTFSFDKEGKFRSDFDYTNHEENVISFIDDWMKKHIY